MMCDQTDINYSDGDVVWVKLGSCWWPGEVVAPDKLPSDVMPSFRKPPIAVVKFFQEDTYEYVKNPNFINMYNCSKKNEFINKGLYMYRTKHGHMDKFPEDVIRAETAVGGDIEILTRDEFQEEKKGSYAGIFGQKNKKTPSSKRKGTGKSTATHSSDSQYSTPTRKAYKEKSDYAVHILLQCPKTPAQSGIFSSSNSERGSTEEIPSIYKELPGLPAKTSLTPSTPTSATSSGLYSCHACPFSTSRINVLILHSKSHTTSSVFTPPPIQKKSTPKPPKSSPPKPKTHIEKNLSDKTNNTGKTEKVVRKKVTQKKRQADSIPTNSEPKKVKTDEEIKTSLLADWDDGDDDSNDESAIICPPASPKVPVASESPAEPVSAEFPGSEKQLDRKEDSLSPEKAEPSSDSKYDFCEDEDWPVEADAGRKIPRVKNPRNDDTKSVSLDEDEMAKEVAELLSKTAVPELPAAPEPLKVEENFPEPSIVKSPDKRSFVLEEDRSSNHAADSPSPKTIFKTKTFFRSRHSRSQDIIGKYVAEQLAADRMDIVENELNGSESASSPEGRESSPIDHVKVARLAPKIQLKKMKAAQFQTLDKISLDMVTDSESSCETKKADEPENNDTENNDTENNDTENNDTENNDTENNDTENNDTDPDESKNVENVLPTHPLMDVLYPTQEIKPINCENTDKYSNIHSEPVDHFTREKKIYNENKHSPLDNIENDIAPVRYENESSIYSKSTVSAVDALLSVSHDPDRVTKVVSDDPPEDLFEEDKETGSQHSLDNDLYKNGVDEEIIISSDLIEEVETEPCNVNGLNEKVTTNSDIDISENSSNTISSTFESDNKDSDINEIELKTTELADTKESIPSESDLQIAEALINMPGTALQTTTNDTDSKLIDLCDSIIPEDMQLIEHEVCLETVEEEKIIENDTYDKSEINMDIEEESIVDTTSNLALRFETEQEKRDNLKAAQSLVQMSESLEPSIQNSDDNLEATETSSIHDNIASECVIDETKDSDNDTVEAEIVSISSDTNRCEVTSSSLSVMETSSKLMKMLEEPQAPIPTVSKIQKAEPTTTTNLEPITTTTTKFENTTTTKLESKATTNLEPTAKNKFVSTTTTKLEPTTTTKSLLKSTTKSEPKTTSKLEAALGKSERILNFDVAKSSQNKPQLGKQKIIIRRALHNKSAAGSLTDISSSDKIILSKSKPAEVSGVQSYTIQSTPEQITDTSTIVIQPTLRKFSKTPPKLTKLKTQKPLSSPKKEMKSGKVITDDAIFDINSMPIVLSDDILTPENIEKMPVVMTDANVTKPTIVENEKIAISSSQVIKPAIKKTIVANQSQEHTKSSTPNILSKSAKLRGAKPVLVIDKVTGKQKIIMTKAEPVVKEVKQAASVAKQAATVAKQAATAAKQALTAGKQLVTAAPPGAGGKAEKFILLPSGSSPRSGRTQKIVIDPQTGKAHVLVAKEGGDIPARPAPGPAPGPAPAPLAPPAHVDTTAPGGTVMIITNAQGGQSRIMLTPEHEKILFPNKNQPPSTLPKKITHRITTGLIAQQKSAIVTSSPAKATRIVPKQKNAIITSKGQLIVGGRVTTGVASIAPRPAPPLRPAAPEQKPAPGKGSEPLILLQQKSGAVVQLTPAQFEHLQRTGQLRAAAPPAPAPRPRARRPPPAAPPHDPPPAKKPKHEVAIAPAPQPAPAPAAGVLGELDSLEELLPVSSIARAAPTAELPPAPLAGGTALADAQLLAVPGEHFGGPAGSFYLCVKEGGSLTPVDNRPLVLDDNQLVPMPERRDILEAALASSDVFRADGDAPDFRELNASVSVHCRVSETSALPQPIMSPLEQPRAPPPAPPPAVPTSLELPITVTDPRLQPPAISMPLLTDDAPPRSPPARPAPPPPPPPPPPPL